MFVLVFSQLDDLRTFYTSALEYIQQTIADGWKLKDAFKLEDLHSLNSRPRGWAVKKAPGLLIVVSLTN